MLFKKIFFIIFSVYFTSTVYGQDGELQSYQNGFYIKQFSEAAGLVHNTCNSLFQDSRGFLWISTRNGLSRFDGNNLSTME